MGNKSKSNIIENVQVHIKAVDCGFKADSKDSYCSNAFNPLLHDLWNYGKKMLIFSTTKGHFYKIQ